MVTNMLYTVSCGGLTSHGILAESARTLPNRALEAFDPPVSDKRKWFGRQM